MTQPEQRDARGMYLHPLTGDAYWSVSRVVGLLDKGFGLRRWLMGNAAEAGLRLAVQEARRVLLEGATREETLQQIAEERIVSRLRKAAVDMGDDSTAADLGSAVHAVVEREWYEHVPDEDVDPSVKPYLEQFRRWRERWLPEPVLVETTVYNHTHGYAGTLDAVVTLPGLGTCVLDVKSGKGVYADTAWQLAAYGAAEEVVIGPPWAAEPMPKIDGHVVLHLRPRSARIVPFDVTEGMLDRFVALADVKQYLDGDEWGHAMKQALNTPTEVPA